MIYRYDTNRYIAWIFNNVNSESIASMAQRLWVFGIKLKQSRNQPLDSCQKLPLSAEAV